MLLRFLKIQKKRAHNPSTLRGLDNRQLLSKCPHVEICVSYTYIHTYKQCVCVYIYIYMAKIEKGMNQPPRVASVFQK